MKDIYHIYNFVEISSRHCQSQTIRSGDTLFLVESFIESEVPHLRLFLVKIMMPLKRWVATENVLTALLGN